MTAGGALGLALVVSVVRFAWADPPCVVWFARQRKHPAEPHNLAHFSLGPRLEVSSNDWFGYHHPAMLIDGDRQGDLTGTWKPDARDRQPQIELGWQDRTAHVGEVVLYARPGPRGATATVECLRADGATRSAPQVVADRTVFAMACSGARGVRIRVGPATQLTEIEVNGR